MYVLNYCYSLLYRYDQWDKFTKEVEELNLSVGNFTVSINQVTKIMFIHKIESCLQ
jgi:hypothetical protein